jgi:hypothetical protein
MVSGLFFAGMFFVGTFFFVYFFAGEFLLRIFFTGRKILRRSILRRSILCRSILRRSILRRNILRSENSSPEHSSHWIFFRFGELFAENFVVLVLFAGSLWFILQWWEIRTLTSEHFSRIMILIMMIISWKVFLPMALLPIFVPIIMRRIFRHNSFLANYRAQNSLTKNLLKRRIILKWGKCCSKEFFGEEISDDEFSCIKNYLTRRTYQRRMFQRRRFRAIRRWMLRASHA